MTAPQVCQRCGLRIETLCPSEVESVHVTWSQHASEEISSYERQGGYWWHHAFVPPSMAHEKIPLYYSEEKP